MFILHIICSLTTYMKRLSITTLFLILCISCSQLESENSIDLFMLDESLETVYHPATNIVLAKNRKETLLSTKGEEPTHYAVKFFPKSTNELFTLIKAENVMTSFYPFGYTPTNLSKLESNSSSDVFDENPYRETYTNTDGCKEEFVSSVPVIYAYWPINMTIPEEIQHEISYSLALPFCSKVPDTDLKGPVQNYQYPLYIRTYDSFLGSYVPMRNLKVRASYGDLWVDDYTNDNGYVLIDPMANNLVSSVDQLPLITITVIYQTNDWVVSRNSSSSPIHTAIGTVGLLWGMPDNTPPSAYYYTISSVTKECEMHRAVDFYHNSTHQLSSYISSAEQGIVLHAIDTSNTYFGETPYSSITPPTILIYNRTSAPQNECIGSVLHELGHVHHYYKRGFNDYYYSSKFVKESYASYIGWIVGEYYYTSKGYIKTGPDEDVCLESRQYWYPSIGSRFYSYSPFFIDLVDQYNQYETNEPFPNDVISSVPVFDIESMLDYCEVLNDCKLYLQQFVGSFYTQTELTTQMSYY